MGGLVGLQVNDATAVLSSYDESEVERIRAYDRIINGLNKRHFEVHFPRRLTWGLKLLSAFRY